VPDGKLTTVREIKEALLAKAKEHRTKARDLELARGSDGNVQYDDGWYTGAYEALEEAAERISLVTRAEQAYDEVLKAVVPCSSHEERRVFDVAAARLYAVTTIAKSVRYGGTCTPVVCTTFEKAKKIVEQNIGDLWEHSFDLVVIEVFAPDRVYGALLDEQYWYCWRDDHYQAIEWPEAYRGTIGWGIG
jgi:hypothetical protein